nr:ABC transporter [Actinomycetales bacterium]
PYFEAQVEENGYEIEHSVGIHIEPYGVYSETLTDIADIPERGKISVPNDPSNQARALWLLEDAGVFTLDESVDDPTIYDLADNPKNIELVELDAAQLATTLADVSAAVINGNYALDAGLVPSEDAIVLESGEDNPYANIVAFRAGEGADPAVVKLIELLTSDEVRSYIEETWPNGEVIPAF